MSICMYLHEMYVIHVIKQSSFENVQEPGERLLPSNI